MSVIEQHQSAQSDVP